MSFNKHDRKVAELAKQVQKNGEFAALTALVAEPKGGVQRPRDVSKPERAEKLIRKGVLLQRDKQVKTLTYTAFEEKESGADRARVKVGAMPHSRFAYYLNSCRSDSAVKILDGSRTSVEVVKDLIYLRVNLIVRSRNVLNLLTEEGYCLLVSTSKEDLSSLYLWNQATGRYMKLYGMKTMEAPEWWSEDHPFLEGGEKDGALKPGYLVFLSYGKDAVRIDAPGYESLSAGDIKQFKLPMTCVNLDNPLKGYLDEGQEWPDDVTYMEVLKYILTYGCSHHLQDEANPATGERPKVTQKEIADGNNRWDLWSAPQSMGYYVPTVAIFMGKIENAIGHEYMDGGAYLSSRYVAWAMSKVLRGKYRFTTEAVEGICFQCRPYLFKVLAETVSQKYLDEFMDKYSTEVVYLMRGKVTVEEQLALDEAIKSKGKSGAYTGKTVVICDSVFDAKTKGVDVFTDLNGNKSVFDANMPTTLNVLEVSHAEEGNGVRTSTQMLQTLFAANYMATLKLLIDLLASMITRKKEEILSSESRAPKKKDFDPEFPAFGQILSRMLPWFAWKFYYPLYKSSVNITLKGLSRAISRLNLNTEGLHVFVRPDPGMDFGVNVLKCGVTAPDGSEHWTEVLCPGTTAKYILGIKYPKMHFNEFGKFLNISVEEYCRRINDDEYTACDGRDLKLTEKQKELLKAKIRSTSPGVCVLPAYAVVMNMLAGLDFDGSSIFLFTAKRIISIIRHMEPIAIIKPDYPEES